MAAPIFSKISEINLNFPEFAPGYKKMSSFHLFILEVQSILESYDQTGHPKIFWSTFNFCEFVSTRRAISLNCPGDMVD